MAQTIIGVGLLAFLGALSCGGLYMLFRSRARARRSRRGPRQKLNITKN